MQFTWNQVEKAFTEGDITLEQLVEVLTENFGEKKTQKILKYNLKLALKQEKEIENKRIANTSRHPK